MHANIMIEQAPPANNSFILILSLLYKSSTLPTDIEGCQLSPKYLKDSATGNH